MITLNNTTITTTTLEIDSPVYKDFLVDIVRYSDKFEAYLYHKDFGIKSLAFGADTADTKEPAFLRLVRGTIEQDIADYITEYMSN